MKKYLWTKYHQTYSKGSFGIYAKHYCLKLKLVKKNVVSVIYWPNKLNINLFVCRTPSIIFQEIIVLMRKMEEKCLETKKRNVICWNSYFRLKIILFRTLINIIKNDQIKLIKMTKLNLLKVNWDKEENKTALKKTGERDANTFNRGSTNIYKNL